MCHEQDLFDDTCAKVAAVFTLLASTLVSYTRAQDERFGVDPGIGLITRAERVLLAAGQVLEPRAPAINILFVLAALTVGQRIAHISCALKART